MDPKIEKVRQRFEAWTGVLNPEIDGWERWDRMWFLEQRSCSIKEFMNLSEDQAVVYGYRTLLGRNPDPGGFSSYLQRLQSGQIQRADLFFELRSSPEGAAWNADLCDVWPEFFSMMRSCKKLWRWIPFLHRVRLRLKSKKHYVPDFFRKSKAIS